MATKKKDDDETLVNPRRGPGFKPLGRDPAARSMRAGAKYSNPKPRPGRGDASFGTRAGQYVGQLGSELGAAGSAIGHGVGTLNRAAGRAVTYPTRAGIGFLRDFGLAVQGEGPSRNEGEAVPFGPDVQLPRINAPERPPISFGIQQVAGGKPETAPVGLARLSPGASGSVGGGPSRSQLRPTTKPSRTTSAANGPTVYSDGSGGIPKTSMQPKSGGTLNVVPSSAITRPLLGDILGHTATPEEGIQYQQNLLQRPGKLFGNGPTQAQQAASERNAIASGDWRSPAGNAAHRLQRQFGMTNSASERDFIAQQMAALSAGSNAAAQTAMQGQNAQGLARTQNQGLFRNTELAGQNALAQGAQEGRQAMAQGAQEGANLMDQGRLVGQNALTLERQRQSAPNQVTLADGSIGLVNPQTATLTPVTLPDGKAAKAGGKDNPARQRAQEVIDDLNAGVQDAITALVAIGSPPTPEQILEIKKKVAMGMTGVEAGADEDGNAVIRINGQEMRL
ncbi:MAG: hypothetical protein L0H83_01360 [Salinisphaera sp.]|nr:hypothetical protein [Salinisphaera sp.]